MSTATAAKPAKPTMEFDDAKLANMVEPITMHVERIVGGKPVPRTQDLPVRPGESTGGVGWTRDDVKNLAQYIFDHWEPGLYYCSATAEDGTKMKWQVLMPTIAQPAPQPVVSVVDPVTAQVVPMTPVVPPQPSPQHLGGPVPQPNWLHLSPPSYPPPNSYGIPASYMSGAGYMGGLPAQSPVTFGTPLRAVGETDTVRQEREARLKLEGQIERERLENRYTSQINAVQSEVRQIVDTLRSTGAESATEKQLRAQLDELKRQTEQNQLAQLMDRSRQDMMALVTALKDSGDKQIAAMQQQIAAIAQRPAGPDPTMTMMMEMMRLNAERATSESARQLELYRLQQEAQSKVWQAQLEAQKSQMGPREWIELFKGSNQTAEAQAQAYNKAWEMMMQGVEAMLQAQGPQIHPALQMLGEGIQGGLGIAQRAVEARAEAAQAQVQVGAQQAQANLAVASELRAMRAQQIQQATKPLPPPEPEGESDEESDDEDDEGTAQADGAEPLSENVFDRGARSPEAIAEEKKRDKAQFGDAYDEIKKLRLGVRTGQLDAMKAAMAITTGVSRIIEMPNVNVPAFSLWREGRLAELIGLMLPEAKESFRQKVEEAIFALHKHAQQQAAQQAANAAGARTGKR